MKILNLSGYTWENGGPAHVIFEHTEQQLKLGHEVDILTPYKGGEKFYPLPEGANLFKCKSNWISKFFPDFSFETIRFFKENIKKYDVIHVHGLWNFPGLLPFWFKHNAVTIITIHGTIGVFSRNKGKLKKWIYSTLFQKSALDKFDIVQMHQQIEFNDLKNYMGKVHPNTVVIPNGVDCSKYANLPQKGAFRKKYKIADDKKIVLFLGRLDAKKGVDLLIQAFDEVAQKCPESVLALVGPDYGMLEYVNNYAAAHQLTDKVVITGTLKDQNKLEAFVDADIFTLPSHSESFSIAGMEAMLCGLPVVISDQVGYPEHVIKHKTGLVIDLNPDAIAEGLLTLLQDDELRKNYAKNAIDLVKNNFDVSIVAKQLVDVMQDALNKKKQK